MPIIVSHQPSPDAVGLAAYTSGLGRDAEKRRREQLALLQQAYDKRFQYGMNQLRYGQEQQLQQDRWNQQKQWQDARDEREFGQKQQLANAEARARGEPLPFPNYGSSDTGTMRGTVLPSGRQVYEGPQTTITGDSGAFGGAAGGGIGGSMPLQPTGPMTPYQRQQVLAQQQQAHQEQMARDKMIADAESKGQWDRGDNQKKLDKINSDLSKLEDDDTMRPEDKDRLRAQMEAKRSRLWRTGQRKVQQGPEEFPLQGGGSVVRQPNGTWLHVQPQKPDITPAQALGHQQKYYDEATKHNANREKMRVSLEEKYNKVEAKLREDAAKEVAEEAAKEGATTHRTIFGMEVPWSTSGAWTAKEAEADPTLKARIDQKMEEEKRAWVDDPVEAAYPAARYAGSFEDWKKLQGAAPTTPAPAQTPPPAAAPAPPPPRVGELANPAIGGGAQAAPPSPTPAMGGVDLGPMPTQAPAAPSATPVVKTDADWDALPSGTMFIGPDGKQYRKN